MATATADNFEGTITRVAPAGGATAGTLIYDSTMRALFLAMTTATSGNNYTAKAFGLIRGAPVSSAAAVLGGFPLTWSTATSKFAKATSAATTFIQGWANSGVASGSTTIDVVLTLPVGWP